MVIFCVFNIIVNDNSTYLRIDTGGCRVIRATPVFNYIARLHSSIRILLSFILNVNYVLYQMI